jgi:hypothetical protein
VPAQGEVLVKMKAAAINPGEAKIREGLLHARWPATFPSGEGSDLAGIVTAIGVGVEGVTEGDEVIGFTDRRASYAEYVAVEAQNLTRKPANVSWEIAGALPIAGSTAYASMRDVSLKPGDTVAVSGAAGGVGSITVQLARRAGAEVIGIAGPGNHEWLTAHGMKPVAYGDSLAERLRGAGIDAFIDTHGSGYVKLAIELGVAPDRINTIIDFAAAQQYRVKTEGSELLPARIQEPPPPSARAGKFSSMHIPANSAYLGGGSPKRPFHADADLLIPVDRCSRLVRSLQLERQEASQNPYTLGNGFLPSAPRDASRTWKLWNAGCAMVWLKTSFRQHDGQHERTALESKSPGWYRVGFSGWRAVCFYQLFWRSCPSPFLHDGDRCYQISKSGSLERRFCDRKAHCCACRKAISRSTDIDWVFHRAGLNGSLSCALHYMDSAATKSNEQQRRPGMRQESGVVRFSRQSPASSFSFLLIRFNGETSKEIETGPRIHEEDLVRVSSG